MFSQSAHPFCDYLHIYKLVISRNFESLFHSDICHDLKYPFAGILVMSIQWRGKEYCGCFIDSSKQGWALPRYVNFSHFRLYKYPISIIQFTSLVSATERYYGSVVSRGYSNHIIHKGNHLIFTTLTV